MYLCAKLEVDRMKTVGDSGIASLEGVERRESRERVEGGARAHGLARPSSAFHSQLTDCSEIRTGSLEGCELPLCQTGR